MLCCGEGEKRVRWPVKRSRDGVCANLLEAFIPPFSRLFERFVVRAQTENIWRFLDFSFVWQIPSAARKIKREKKREKEEKAQTKLWWTGFYSNSTPSRRREAYLESCHVGSLFCCGEVCTALLPGSLSAGQSDRDAALVPPRSSSRSLIPTDEPTTSFLLFGGDAIFLFSPPSNTW